MRIALRVAWFGLGFCFLVPGQTFEVATIRATQSAPLKGEGSERESVAFDPAALTMKNVSLKACLRWAYGLNDYEIAAPSWMENSRFDIQARGEGSLTRDEARKMLQNLLASRFHMKVHRDPREIPVYELVVNKPARELEVSQSEGQAQMRPTENGALAYKHYSMPQFAESLTAIPFRVDRTVVDQTKLDGAFDFQLKIADNAVEMKRGLERGDGPSAFEVLGQIGLKLRPRKDVVSVLVVDSADRTPSEN